MGQEKPLKTDRWTQNENLSSKQFILNIFFLTAVCKHVLFLLLSFPKTVFM